MLWIPIILGAAVLVWAVSIFNRLVGLRNRAKGSWSDIDVQLKRRHDLVGTWCEPCTATPSTSGKRCSGSSRRGRGRSVPAREVARVKPATPSGTWSAV